MNKIKAFLDRSYDVRVWMLFAGGWACLTLGAVLF